MNKKPMDGSFAETDEAMGESKFSLSGFGVDKSAGGEVVMEVMIQTNM